MSRKAMVLDGLSEEYLAERAKLPACQWCDRPMRPYGTPAKSWPATMARSTTKTCQSCYRLHGSKEAEPARQMRHGSAQQPGELSRREIAAQWSVAQHAVAFTICSRFELEVAEELMQTLGLLDSSSSGSSWSPAV